MGFSRTIVLAFASAWMGAALAFAAAPELKLAPKVQRWTEVRLVAELRAKDTPKINVITAGEEQESSYDQCAKAADVALCRIIVSAVSVAAIIGSSVTGR